jgi:hypothetical protein
MLITRRGLESEALMEPTWRTATAIQRVKELFRDQPGIELSAEDTTRLLGLDSHLCRCVLDALEHGRFLARRERGRFVHHGDNDRGDAWYDTGS